MEIVYSLYSCINTFNRIFHWLKSCTTSLLKASSLTLMMFLSPMAVKLTLLLKKEVTAFSRTITSSLATFGYYGSCIVCDVHITFLFLVWLLSNDTDFMDIYDPCFHVEVFEVSFLIIWLIVNTFFSRVNLTIDTVIFVCLSRTNWKPKPNDSWPWNFKFHRSSTAQTWCAWFHQRTNLL